MRLGIHWRSGAAEELVVSRPIPVTVSRRTPARAVDLVRHLFERSDEEIVAELRSGGFLTGGGRPFDVDAVRWVRYAHSIPRPTQPPLLVPGEATVAEVASHLGITESAVYYWIERRQLETRRGPGGRLCVPFSAKVQEVCRQKVARSTRMKSRVQTLAAGGAV